MVFFCILKDYDVVLTRERRASGGKNQSFSLEVTSITEQLHRLDEKGKKSREQYSAVGCLNEGGPIIQDLRLAFRMKNTCHIRPVVGWIRCRIEAMVVGGLNMVASMKRSPILQDTQLSRPLDTQKGIHETTAGVNTNSHKKEVLPLDLAYRCKQHHFNTSISGHLPFFTPCASPEK